MIGEHAAAFGLRLKTHRERRGITLESIAESTKIKRSLLGALERGDVSQWPLGIFRRAFVRAYAGAIGLQADAVLAEFVQIFPEPGQEGAESRAAQIERAPRNHRSDPEPKDQRSPEGDDAEGSLRLTLAGDGARWLPEARDRAVAAAIDGLTVLAVALTLWIVHASSLGVSFGVAAFGVVIAQGLLSGRSGVAQWLKSPTGDARDDDAPHALATVAPPPHRGGRRGSNRPGARHVRAAARRERLRRAGA